MVFVPVDIDCLVLQVGRYTEMVVLGIRFKILYKLCLYRRLTDDIPCLHRIFARLPQSSLGKAYRILALDY